MARRQRLLRWLPHSDQRGVVAIYVAILTPVLFGLAAFAVDVSRWYVELQRLQRAADAGALAAAPFMPDVSDAAAAATTEVSRNGYPSTAVLAQQGSRPSQVRVTVTATVDNSFARIFGSPTMTLRRSAVGEFSSPAPMGSPCNTFGNDPDGSSVTPPCVSEPGFWATIQGPSTAKVQGDQFMTRVCGTRGGGQLPDGCSSAAQNDEFDPDGYFFVLRVTGAAVGQPITVEIYDPAWVNTGVHPVTRQCERWPPGFGTPQSGDCPFDYVPDGSTPVRVDTSFALRAPIDTLDPRAAPVVPGCVKQFRGDRNPEDPQDANATELAQVFRTWHTLCTISNAQAGDYYLQVRTNRRLPDTGPAIVVGSPAATSPGDDLSAVGNGNNAFAIRAVPSSPSASSGVTVAAWQRMPIFMNADSSDATFKLIRATPAAASATITLMIFDVGDATASGSVSVLPPEEAAGSAQYGVGFGAGGTVIDGCVASNVNPGPLSQCRVGISSTQNNGRAQVFSVPIPAGYNCDVDDPGGCLFRLRVQFATGNVADITTWTALLNTDPVRLVE